jgi:hypothetical protein
MGEKRHPIEIDPYVLVDVHVAVSGEQIGICLDPLGVGGMDPVR